MTTIKNIAFAVVCLMLAAVPSFAQDIDKPAAVTDIASVSVGRARPLYDAPIPMPHPYHVEARHWAVGLCDDAKAMYDLYGALPEEGSDEALNGCGEKFMEYDGENLTTSAGAVVNSKQMGDTAAQPASCNYVALTNSSITPAVADTTLSGEISSNGLQRAQGTFTDTSAAIGTPPTAGSLATVGTSGAATLDYWVFACTYQGCTAVGTQAQITTANATLSNANYVTGSFTGKLGASHYVIVRTNSGTPPSGSLSGGSTQASSGAIGGYISCGALVAGTAPTCTFADQSNTVTAFAVPASDQTYVGKFTITKTFTATGSQSAQAFGIFNASSNGTLCWEGTFTSASLVTNDTLAFTETVYH